MLYNIRVETIVYSTLIGDYDQRYTDRLLIESVPDEIEHLSDRRKSRYFKINSHLIGKHDISIYVDASAVLTNSFNPLINEFLEMDVDIAAWRHPKSNSIEDHLQLCLKYELADKIQGYGQLMEYLKDGFPDDLGLSENTLLIRKNNKRVKKFNEFWWKAYCCGSERDQLSMMYALWKTNPQFSFLEGSARNNIYYTGWNTHLKTNSKQDI